MDKDVEGFPGFTARTDGTIWYEGEQVTGYVCRTGALMVTMIDEERRIREVSYGRALSLAFRRHK